MVDLQWIYQLDTPVDVACIVPKPWNLNRFCNDGINTHHLGNHRDTNETSKCLSKVDFWIDLNSFNIGTMQKRQVTMEIQLS